MENCNEITVKIKGNLEEFYKKIQCKGFQVIDKFTMEDTYLIPSELNLDELSTREIISKAVIVRVVKVINPPKNVQKITFKNKEFDELGNITYQSKVECDILNQEDAKKVLAAIGYKEIMKIIESDIVFEKDGFQFAVKDIENGEKLIESEPDFNIKEIDTLEKVKLKFDEHDIPIYKDNYFVKKAELELNKILNRNFK